MNRLIVLFALGLTCIFSNHAFAQDKKKQKNTKEEQSIYDVDTLINTIPMNRVVFHDKIDKEQNRADVSDGAKDGTIFFDDAAMTAILDKALFGYVDHLQIMIENLPARTEDDKAMDNQTRIRYLSALLTAIKKFNNDRSVNPVFYKKLFENLRALIIARHEGKVLDFVRTNANIYTFTNIELYKDNQEAKNHIYTEMGKQEPRMLIKKLQDFINEPYADGIVAEAARVSPADVYDYASSTNTYLNSAIKRNKDPLVQTILQIAQKSGDPLKALPFINDIYSKKLTIAEVDKITSNPDLYYKNLVRLKVENQKLGAETYTDELAYRGLQYVRKINELHDAQDPVRFKVLEPLSAVDLYYMMIYGQDEIYTSSFIGSFKRMLERMKPMKGNELLDTVNMEHFRTFIRMCAGYNTLSTFLGTIDEAPKTSLMKKFVSGLEKGKDDELEDAVDVADAYGSLRDSVLSDFLLNEVRSNYERCASIKSKKGLIIYGLLATIFNDFKKSNLGQTTDESLSNELNIPPITKVPYSKLYNNGNDIVFQQVFFYGDEDGKASYNNSFIGTYTKDPGTWKVEKSQYWVKISSLKGKPTVIYANLPLTEPEDEKAQQKLAQHMNENNIVPSIITHRGHSYHLPTTLEHLTKETKIVVLGSCGGYHNLAQVLDRSPDANIISSKQTGAMAVNDPIIKAINNNIMAGEDIDWVKIWKELGGFFASKPKELSLFNDYVPPHRNLGAIFIKAYRKIYNKSEQ